MADVFAQVLRASLYGGILIGAVCLLRLLLKSAPRKLTCMLWLLVGLRLLMPFEIESKLSLQPKLAGFDQGAWIQSEEVISEAHGEILNEQGEVLATRPLNQGRGEVLDSQGEVLITKPLMPNSQVPEITMESLFPWLWLAGVAGMGIYSLIAYLRLRRRVKDCIVLEEGIWFCLGLDTAFVLGLWRPQIYLPGLTESEMGFVVSHEKAHIARKDHWWKFLGYVALAIHWFNPLVWLGYVLLCRDLEMACDEAVIRSLDLPERKAYSQALLSCAARHAVIGACPVAFGEVSVRERIKSVMKYKKPKFWICLIAVLAVLVAAVCFLTVPSTADEEIAARLGGNVYTWEKKYADVFSFEIELDEDGTFYFVDGVEPCIAGMGVWSVEDAVLELRDDIHPSGTRYFCFRVEGDDLVFLEDKSAAFEYTEVVDGDRFHRIEDIGNVEERLAQCRDVFEKLSSYEDYHATRHDWSVGDSSVSSVYREYWKLEDGWLYTVSNWDAAEDKYYWRLQKNGIGYLKQLYQLNQWTVVENDTMEYAEGIWYKEFNWEKANIQYVRTDIINNNKERVTLRVVEDPSAFGRYCPYTVSFLFTHDGGFAFAQLVLHENKGEENWIRTSSACYINDDEDIAGMIDASYQECVKDLGPGAMNQNKVRCNDKYCNDFTHDHSLIHCVDTTCTNTAHEHYGIACTVEHCDNPAHGHGDHDHH